MALKDQKKTLLAKIETTYGVDSVPTGAANGISVRNVSITPLESDLKEREVVRPFLGNFAQLHSGTYVMLECEVEMAGSGTSGAGITAPAYGPLLRGCSMAQTIDLATGLENVNYKPISSGEESLTLYFNLDGVFHKMLGCRGTFSMSMDVKEIPKFIFKFWGLYVAVVDAAQPAVTLSGFVQPLPVNNTNTLSFALHGYAGSYSNLNIDMANDVVYRLLVGQESIQSPDRKPTGSITIEAPTIAQKDFFTAARNATTGPLTVTHGTVAGNKVKIDAPNVQVIKPNYTEQDKITMMQMGLSFIPGATGNDEIKISVS